MIVVAAVGRNASGKDELAEYVHDRCQVPVLASGDIARQLAKERGVANTRQNLHDLSREVMAEHGEDFFMRRMIDEIEDHDWTAVVISGVRTPADVETLRERFGSDLLVVHVDVSDPRERYRRMQERDAPRDPDSYQEFLRQEQEEDAMFSLDDTLRQADMTIPNDSSLNAFHERIEENIIKPVLQDRVDCQGQA